MSKRQSRGQWSSFLNQACIHLFLQMVSKNHAGDLDLYDRARTRRHSLSLVASANQLPVHSAGNFQQQSEQKARGTDVREPHADVCAPKCAPQQKEYQCQES